MTNNTPHAIEEQLERNRAELAATIDELTYRLDPRVKANEVLARTKQLIHDAGTDPATTPEDRNRARTFLGIGAGTLAAIVAIGTAIARRR